MHELGGSTIVFRAFGVCPRRAWTDQARIGDAVARIADLLPWRMPGRGGETTQSDMAKTPPEKDPSKQDSGEDADSPRKDAGTAGRARSPESAFDMWLQRELQKMFSDVTQEPIPDDLLRLIDQDKLKRK
jgi:hypothetical protein